MGSHQADSVKSCDQAERSRPPSALQDLSSREAVNRALREAGLSSLHNIRRVQRLDALPLLGTGKTDYVALKHLAATPA